MIRTKGEPGTGDIIRAVRHIQTISKSIESLKSKSDNELIDESEKMQVPYALLKEVKKQKLPVVNFAAGGITTSADAIVNYPGLTELVEQITGTHLQVLDLESLRRHYQKP